MKSLPGKIAVVQVSSGASCNASLPSTGQGLLCAALGGAIDYRLDVGRFKALPAVSVWSDFDELSSVTGPNRDKWIRDKTSLLRLGV